MHILYEDNHLIIVNKRCGEIVQADPSGDVPLEQTVKDYIKAKYNKPGEVFLGVVHRVDRPVSGAVLFARTSKSLARLNQMFQDKAVQKTYWAIVKERPPKENGTLEHYIKRDTVRNLSRAYTHERPGTQKAILQYHHIASSEHYHLLEIDLQTGRHHQIRCQLAEIGCPVRGDLKYGYPRSNAGGGIHLHALRICFQHPVRDEKIRITAPLPEDALWQSFQQFVKI
ncbi:MAG: RluA family pseudouridine synthase [Bacteroidales bacterium]|nr:RluA family pseudouridine synthase [Bacteroidales bacterium]